MQYIQSITSTQTCKVSSLTEVTLTHLVNASSLRRSTDVPTPFHRLATKVSTKQASFGKGSPLLNTTLLSFDIFENWKMIKQNNHEIKSILSSTSNKS